MCPVGSLHIAGNMIRSVWVVGFWTMGGMKMGRSTPSANSRAGNSGSVIFPGSIEARALHLRRMVWLGTGVMAVLLTSALLRFAALESSGSKRARLEADLLKNKYSGSATAEFIAFLQGNTIKSQDFVSVAMIGPARVPESAICQIIRKKGWRSALSSRARTPVFLPHCSAPGGERCLIHPLSLM